MFSIFHDIEILSDEIRIFEAISSPEGLNNWWTLRSSGTPEFGNEYNFYFSDAYNWSAKVINIKTSESISYQMTDASEDWVGTILQFQLIPRSNGKCLLRFEHRGWHTATDHYRRTSYCWALYLSCLKNYVEHGVVKEYNQRGM